MARINARAKGNAGERELAEWFQSAFSLPVKPKRNLEQVRGGGCDLIIPPFAVECKRVEKLDLLSWWSQIQRAVKAPDDLVFGFEPVVAYRQNKMNWNFLISAKHIGVDTGFIQLTPVAFKKWVNVFLDKQYKLGNLPSNDLLDYLEGEK